MNRYIFLFLFLLIFTGACVELDVPSQPIQAPNAIAAEEGEPVTAVPTITPTPLPTPIATPTPRPELLYDGSWSSGWALEETFDGEPEVPSQDLLPRTFDYAVTHRTHPIDHFHEFTRYPADYDENCNGPETPDDLFPQHLVTTSHYSNGKNPDDSFYICNNQMMSSMGNVADYSVTSFWPRQEFNFSQGGTIEFDLNIDFRGARSWIEILIMPRSQMRVGAAHSWAPIDETYPTERIVFELLGGRRSIHVGTELLDPEGKLADMHPLFPWHEDYPTDPALQDRTIQRTNRIEFEAEAIHWSIEKEDGTFDTFTVDIPGGLPFTQGIVMFNTHAFTPDKDGNVNNYTFHWDNIRFSGPVTGRYESFEAEDVVHRQDNGHRAIGEQAVVIIDLPHIGSKPVLFGQVSNAMEGQVLLSVNGRPNIAINPYDYNPPDYDPQRCSVLHWKTFQMNLDPDWLVEGENSFTWTIGPRPDCAEETLWNGFSIKGLEVQFDLEE